MNEIIDKITSFELYLKYPPQQVVETRCIEDVGCGMYPCYFLRKKDKLKVSTSVVSLILDSGKFKINSKFKPPDFMAEKIQKYAGSNNFEKMLNVFFLAIVKRKPWILKIALKKYLNFFLPNISGINSWKWNTYYATWKTIDRRINKLRPFEQVTLTRNNITFKPDFKVNSKNELINKSIYYLKKFVNKIEKDFPSYNHIVMTGGKDSQIILLIPKLNNDRWHIFSAEPNYQLVKQWIEVNRIKINNNFIHNNLNEESHEDFKGKILCGDLYSDPRHIRWMPTLKKIANKFDNKCIFWIGTAADAIYKYYSPFHAYGKRNFFKVHRIRVASWQGNYHQIFKNFVGSPLLSPYHSEEIWRELYQHLDPSIIRKNTDLRVEIGEKLFGSSIKWLDKNPGPGPYKYNYDFKLYDTYVHCINELIDKKELISELK